MAAADLDFAGASFGKRNLALLPRVLLYGDVLQWAALVADRKLRLRNGDVITGVNGQTIASVEDAMSVFGTLSTDGPIQVNIKRRGREETLEYRIE